MCAKRIDKELNVKKSVKRFISFICMVVIVVVSTGKSQIYAENLFKINLDDLDGKLVIIHTNDTHGFLLKDSDRSLDAATLISVKKIFESVGAEVLLVDSGDTLFGTPMFDKNLGNDMTDLINEIGYDAITTGNHDYDYGGKKLLDLASKLTVPLVVSNLIYSTSKKPALKRYTIVEKGKSCIGIFGITTPEEITGFEKYGDESLQLTDPIVAAKEMSKKLKKEGADFIIALGHIGMDGRSELSSIDVISEVPEIDLFIDAHSHSSLKLRMIHEDGSQTLLVRNLHYFSEIGIVVVDEDRYMKAYTIHKAEMQKFIEAYQ